MLLHIITKDLTIYGIHARKEVKLCSVQGRLKFRIILEISPHSSILKRNESFGNDDTSEKSFF